MKKFLYSASFILAFILVLSSTLTAAELIRRNISWTIESGNDPFVQITNESDNSKILTIRILIAESSYRWRADYEVPSGENRFIRVRDVLGQLSEKYSEITEASTGVMQLEFEGLDRDLATRIVNLSPKAGVTSEREQDQMRAPVISSIEPKAGDPSGGTVVRIVGDNFSESTEVKFGGLPAMRSLQSKEVLVAVAPAHAVGAVDVEVSNGRRKARLEKVFKYEQEGPVISSVDPDRGPMRGGIKVSIQGRNFQPGATVRWDGRSVTASFQPPDTLSVVVPQGNSGSVDIEVINPDGKKFLLDDGFTYRGLPQITSINPGMGRTEGGYTVTINGSNFEEGASVLFGGRYGQTTFINANTLAAIVPQGESGMVDITITNPDGESITFRDGFLFNEPPQIREISASPNPIVRLTQTTILVDAFDPEVENLDFEYRVAQGPAGGYITGSGNEVIYNSPNNSGTAIIQVTVYDQHRAKDQATIEIEVQ